MTLSGDGMAGIWDVASGRNVNTLSSVATGAWAFSPDRKQVVNTCSDETARICEVAGGRILYTLIGPTDFVLGAAFSPDGNRSSPVASMG